MTKTKTMSDYFRYLSLFMWESKFPEHHSYALYKHIQIQYSKSYQEQTELISELVMALLATPLKPSYSHQCQIGKHYIYIYI